MTGLWWLVALACGGMNKAGSRADTGGVHGDDGEPGLAPWGEGVAPEVGLGDDDGGADDGGADDGGTEDGGDDGDDTGDGGTARCDWWAPEKGEMSEGARAEGIVDIATETSRTQLGPNGGSEDHHAIRIDHNGDGWRELAFTGGSWYHGDGYLSAFRFYSADWRSEPVLSTVDDWCAQITPGKTDPNILGTAVLDADADGFDDVILRDDRGDDPSGRLTLFLGPFADGTTPYEGDWWVDNPVGNLSWASTTALGDVTGNATTDMMVGWFNPTGRHRVMLLDGDSLLETTDLLSVPAYLEGGDGETRGFAGLLLADITGDGIDDAHVLSVKPDVGGGWVIYDGPVDAVRDWKDYTAYLVQDDSYELFGTAWSGGTDLDGDGYDDLVLGAYLGGEGYERRGRTFVFHGPLSGAGYASDLAVARISSHILDGRFGRSLTAEADLDADGWPDLAIGAPFQELGADDLPGTDIAETEGAVYLYYGPVEGELSTTDADATLVHPDIFESMGSGFGEEVTALGDLDGDGIDDLWIRPTHYDAPSSILFGGVGR